MALILWEPVREMRSARRWVPAMDLVETDDGFLLTADLPGLRRDDVAIEVADGVLTISGAREFRHETKKGAFHRIERSSGAFSRSLTLPKDIDPELIAARFEDGVLEVRIPKPEERRPRRVEISVADDRPQIVEGTETPTAA
jgi:HSP20 family protein